MARKYNSTLKKAESRIVQGVPLLNLFILKFKKNIASAREGYVAITATIRTLNKWKKKRSIFIFLLHLQCDFRLESLFDEEKILRL